MEESYAVATDAFEGSGASNAFVEMPAAENGVALGQIETELRADAARRLNRALLHMERFLRRDECQALPPEDPTRLLAQRLCHEGRHMLRGALHEDAVHIAESTFRTAYRLIAALANLAAWSAPASQESAAINSFPVAAARDVVAYARYGCADTAVQELVYTTMLGFDPAQARLLLTSSGMAAYALIENFLLRDVLRPADCVVLHPGVYFETQQQLKALQFLDVRSASGAGRSDILQAIALHRPKVVFVDPLTNSADFRVIDLSRLLEAADRVCATETWFVVDGTLLSGGFDPFCGAQRRNVRVLYYESGCKYLQFGMDLGPAGVVVIETGLAERFERLRRGIGAVGSETQVLPQASRGAYLGYLRAQSECARAVAQAAAIESHAAVLTAVFPSQIDHPDFEEARAYPHLGGVLVFRFVDAGLNRRKPLEAFIDRLMALARCHALPLTAGVSFGFRIPRIGAAWSSYDADDAFLRVSAGTDREVATRLGRLIRECALSFVAANPQA